MSKCTNKDCNKTIWKHSNIYCYYHDQIIYKINKCAVCGNKSNTTSNYIHFGYEVDKDDLFNIYLHKHCYLEFKQIIGICIFGDCGRVQKVGCFCQFHFMIVNKNKL